MKKEYSKSRIKAYLQQRLRKDFPSATDKDIEDASKKMSEIVVFLVDIPACESAAVGIGFSVRQSSEIIAKESNLKGDKVCDIIFEATRVFSSSRSN